MSKGKKWAERLGGRNEGFNEDRQALISQNAETLIKQSTNTNNSTSENASIANNTSSSDSTVEDPLDSLLNAENDQLLYRGYYLEKDVVSVIEKLGKKGGKGRGGIKSKIVNEALKQVFKEKGWM